MIKRYAVSDCFFYVAVLLCAKLLSKGTYRSPFESGTNGKTAVSENRGIKGQRFLVPIIGYENYCTPNVSKANTALLGLDFMYRRNSGFTV